MSQPSRAPSGPQGSLPDAMQRHSSALLVTELRLEGRVRSFEVPVCRAVGGEAIPGKDDAVGPTIRGMREPACVPAPLQLPKLVHERRQPASRDAPRASSGWPLELEDRAVDRVLGRGQTAIAHRLGQEARNRLVEREDVEQQRGVERVHGAATSMTSSAGSSRPPIPRRSARPARRARCSGACRSGPHRPRTSRR